MPQRRQAPASVSVGIFASTFASLAPRRMGRNARVERRFLRADRSALAWTSQGHAASACGCMTNPRARRATLRHDAGTLSLEGACGRRDAALHDGPRHGGPRRSELARDGSSTRAPVGGGTATTDPSTEVLLLPARSRGSRSTAAIALGADAPECHHPDAHRSRPARTVTTTCPSPERHRCDLPCIRFSPARPAGHVTEGVRIGGHVCDPA